MPRRRLSFGTVMLLDLPGHVPQDGRAAVGTPRDTRRFP
jgi:hypothetical protein